jgi:hypothetical protein
MLWFPKRSLISAITIGVLMQSASVAEPQAAAFKITTRKPADKVVLATEDGKTILDVFSADGIGSATVRRAGTQWLEKLTVRLHLQNLEMISLSTGKLALKSRLGGDQWEQSPQGNAVTKAEIRNIGNAIEVEVPDVLLRDNPDEMKIEWINEYRR